MIGLGLVELALLGVLFLLVVAIVTAVIVARLHNPRD